MNCTSCGSPTPDGSVFCLNCGARLAASVPASTPALSWDFDEFVYRWSPGEFVLRFPSFTADPSPEQLVEARVTCWNLHKLAILEKLQDRLDQGWQLTGELGPSDIQLRIFCSARRDCQSAKEDLRDGWQRLQAIKKRHGLLAIPLIAAGLTAAILWGAAMVFFVGGTLGLPLVMWYYGRCGWSYAEATELHVPMRRPK